MSTGIMPSACVYCGCTRDSVLNVAAFYGIKDPMCCGAELGETVPQSSGVMS